MKWVTKVLVEQPRLIQVRYLCPEYIENWFGFPQITKSVLLFAHAQNLFSRSLSKNNFVLKRNLFNPNYSYKGE